MAKKFLNGVTTNTLQVTGGTIGAGKYLQSDGSGNATWQTITAGDVTGPASSTASAVPIFSGTTGKVLSDSGKLLPAGTIVGTTDTQTLSGKRMTPRYLGGGASGTYTPAGPGTGEYEYVTANGSLTILGPSGTPSHFEKYTLRIKDNGTAQTLVWGAAYRFVGVQQPFTTVAGKTMYVEMVYNLTDSLWDITDIRIEGVAPAMVKKRSTSSATQSTVTAGSDNYDFYILTAQVGALTLANPSGTPTDGQQLQFRIKSASSVTISYGTQFRGSTDVPLPTSSTGSSKTDYLGFQYNAADTKWDLMAKNFGF